MKKDTERLSDNISQILDLGKIEDRKYPLDISKIYLADFIKGIVNKNEHIFKDVDIEFVGASEVNANPKDSADHPFGVWTLPPVSRTPREGETVPEGFNADTYLAIGESDRYTLKFRKPTAQ